MKITICGSLDFTYKIKDIADQLSNLGHEVFIPMGSRKILDNEIALTQIMDEKKSDHSQSAKRKIRDDVIRAYWETIKKSEAILVVNYDKKGVEGYIGGNTFLEMGFAHVLNKKIFLLNNIPKMLYTDEIEAVQPVVIEGDIKKIV